MVEKESWTMIFKLAVIGVITLALLLPLALIGNLVRERESRARMVAHEVGDLWGGRQRVAGPVISVPVEAVSENGRRSLRVDLLPEELHVEAEVDALSRRRGGFETVVYVTRLRMTDHFRVPDAEVWTRLAGSGAPRWDAATVELAVSDLRGLAASPRLDWQGAPLDLSPSTAGAALPGRGIAAPLPRTAAGVAEFTAELEVRGSSAFEFLPLGRDTTLTMTSDWPDPSFGGAYLPSTPEVSAEGFTASWSIPYFARGYPQMWVRGGGDATVSPEVEASAFGVELLLPVDHYQKTERCTKYGLLFLTLTFATFLLFELLNGLRIHPMQYLMVGFAMCLFFQLLLAFSEHAGFTAAYLVAAAATITTITLYSSTVLKTRRRAAVLGAALTTLYGVLFVLVQLQTYTLLVGSVALFAVLVVFMYLTRDLDWYRLGRRPLNAAMPVGESPAQ